MLDLIVLFREMRSTYIEGLEKLQHSQALDGLLPAWLLCCCCWVTSAMSNSLWPYELQPARLLCPWDSLGKGTRVGCHALLQGIFPTQGSNPGILHFRQILYHCLEHRGAPLTALGSQKRPSWLKNCNWKKCQVPLQWEETLKALQNLNFLQGRGQNLRQSGWKWESVCSVWSRVESDLMCLMAWGAIMVLTFASVD